MRAVVWHGGADLRLEEVEEPRAGDDHVVLDIALAGVCGSDLHAIRGHHGPRRPPLILGHELIGTVEGRDGRFAAFPLVTCGTCAACRRGEENLCERRVLLGLNRQGVFLERLAVGEHELVALPEGLDDEAACLIEPFATALAALRLEDVREGDHVLVIGCGPIGLLTTLGCAVRGASVRAVDPVPERRSWAERLGASSTAEDFATIAPGAADVAVDTVGAEATWSGAIAGVRSGGSVAVVGLGRSEGLVPVGDLVRRGVRLRGVYAYGRDDFLSALRLLDEHRPHLGWVSVVDLDEAPKAFHRLVTSPGQAIKVLIRMQVPR
jgi:threonine dehydrogenase-like Zn-dependent dehydrogenase